MATDNAGLHESIAQLASLLLNEQSLAQELSSIIELVHDAIPGADHASVSIARGDRYETLVASDSIAMQLDQKQYDVNDGPCLQAMRTGVVTAIEDRAEETRFTRFLTDEQTSMVVSSLSFPLVNNGTVVGSLNIYSETARAYTLDDHPAAARLAEQASIVVGNALARDQAVAIAQQIDVAIQSRGTIEQAKGILMEREGIDAERAFVLLRKASQQQNRKLVDVARDLVASVERPPSS